MERRVVIVCCIVGFLGLLSAATGFAAEATKIKPNQVSAPECVYPRSPVLGLALTAAVSLMIAHIIIIVSTGSLCCHEGPHQPRSKWILAQACFIVFRCTFIFGFGMLLKGAVLHYQHSKDSWYFAKYHQCYTLRLRGFAIGSVSSLVSVALGIFYYLVFQMQKNISDTFVPPSQASVSGAGGSGSRFRALVFITVQAAQAPVFVH